MLDTVGVVFARIGSFGDRGDRGWGGNGGLLSLSNRASRTPADFAVVREACEYDDAEDALRVGKPAIDICGEPLVGNWTPAPLPFRLTVMFELDSGDLGESADSVSWSYARPTLLNSDS